MHERQIAYDCAPLRHTFTVQDNNTTGGAGNDGEKVIVDKTRENLTKWASK